MTRKQKSPVRIVLIAALAVTLIIGCDLFDMDDSLTALSNPLLRIFRGRLTFPAGETPFEILTGDLNGDGLRDIVTLNWNTETASVILADGAGAYMQPESHALGASPRAAVLADLSGNGILDLAVANEEHAQVTLLFGDGSGGFTEAIAYNLAEGAAPRAIVAEDLNGDGVMDLATADSGTTTVTLLVGEGGGTFLDPYSLSVEHAPMGLWAGDLTGNGLMDLVTANSNDNTLTLLEGTGEGYLPPRLIACGYMPYMVRVADLNKDGLRDLLVGNVGSGDVSVLYALGDGLFSEEQRISFPHPAGRFVVADFSGNAIPDIAAILFDTTGENRQPLSRFAVLRGDGTGNFGEPAVYGSGWNALAIAAADLTNSGRLDLITADYTTNTMSIAYNRGNALFESDRRFAAGARPTDVIVADFTEDGKTDLAVMNTGDNSISLLAGKGDGTFETLTPIMLPGKPLAIAAGDLNGDGKTDIVVSLTAQTRASVYFAAGPGRFGPPQFVSLQTDSSRGAPEALSLAIGDVNNNGHNDIVSGNSSTDSVSVMLNDGAGRFDAPIVTSVGNYPRNVHLTDTNGDGFLDIVFLSSKDPADSGDASEPRIIRWFGKGDGTFDKETHLRFATSGSPRMLAMADITGNGRLDVVTAHPGENALYVLPGLKNGNFAKATRIYMGYEPVAITMADLNRDGRADLVCTLSAGSVVVRFSREELKFEAPNNFTVSVGMSRSMAADVNGDGILDLIVLNATRNDIGVLLGRAP